MQIAGAVAYYSPMCVSQTRSRHATYQFGRQPFPGSFGPTFWWGGISCTFDELRNSRAGNFAANGISIRMADWKYWGGVLNVFVAGCVIIKGNYGTEGSCVAKYIPRLLINTRHVLVFVMSSEWERIEIISVQ